MALTSDQIDLLRSTLRILKQRGAATASMFYDRLFEVAPEVRPLFSADLEDLTDKVMLALGAVVGQIHDLDACRSMTEELARRHVAYGVEAAHYDKVGIALMITLEAILEESFTPDMERAWRGAYDAIATVMVASAYRDNDMMLN